MIHDVERSPVVPAREKAVRVEQAYYLYLGDVAAALAGVLDPMDEELEATPEVERLARAWAGAWSLSGRKGNPGLRQRARKAGAAIRKAAAREGIAPGDMKLHLMEHGTQYALRAAREPSTIWIGRARVGLLHGRPVLVCKDSIWDYFGQTYVGEPERTNVERPVAPAVGGERGTVLPLADLAKWLGAQARKYAEFYILEGGASTDERETDDSNESGDEDVEAVDPRDVERRAMSRLMTEEARRDAGLTAREWEAVWLVLANEAEYREAAEAMGVAEGTVGAFVHKGRKKLREWARASA